MTMSYQLCIFVALFFQFGTKQSEIATKVIWSKIFMFVLRWRGCVWTRRLFCPSITTWSPRTPEFRCHTTITGLGTCTSRTCRRQIGGGTCVKLILTPCAVGRVIYRSSVSFTHFLLPVTSFNAEQLQNVSFLRKYCSGRTLQIVKPMSCQTYPRGSLTR